MDENEIQLNCQQFYMRNLEYFEKNHPALFRQTALFEVAISQNMYKERFALDVVNNSFDIRKLDDNSLLYNKDLNSDAIKRVSKITLNDNNSFKLFTPIKVPQNYTIDPDITKTHLHVLYPLIEYVQKYSSSKIQLQKLEKFVFFGSLLGRHIDLFVQTHKPKAILIAEKDIEIFKLSLFVTDYSKIAQTCKIVFAITTKEEEFKKAVNEFLKEFDLFNYIIKFAVINDDYLDFINTFLNTLASTRASDFPFSALLMTLKRQIWLMKKGYKFINFNKEYKIFDHSKPVLVVAPGPSLSKNIQWLQENQDKFLIVAFGASLKTLYKADVQPDIITSVDPTLFILDQFKDIPKEFYKDALLFASSNSPKEMLKLFSKKQTYIYQVLYNVINIGTFGGKSIGDVTMAMLLKLGAKEIYLLGTDLSVDAKTGSAHVKEHQHYKEIENVETHDIIENNYISDEDLISVKGNFTDEVLTTRHFESVLFNYDSHIKNLASEDTKIYNLSDGAYIKNTTPIKSEQIDIQDKIDKTKLLNLLSTKIVKKKLKVPFIEVEIELIEKILEILNSYQDKIYNSYENMMYDKLTITIDMLDMFKNTPNNGIGLGLIESFNDNVEGYINTFFNNKINQKKQKRFNKLFHLWLKPQITMFQKYLDLLKQIDKIS